ncbi:MAG TPA: hypothetical protein V6D47_14250 [Oscillatoriaceae cyanobacterium]
MAKNERKATSTAQPGSKPGLTRAQIKVQMSAPEAVFLTPDAEARFEAAIAQADHDLPHQ